MGPFCIKRTTGVIPRVGLRRIFIPLDLPGIPMKSHGVLPTGKCMESHGVAGNIRCKPTVFMGRVIQVCSRRCYARSMQTNTCKNYYYCQSRRPTKLYIALITASCRGRCIGR